MSAAEQWMLLDGNLTCVNSIPRLCIRRSKDGTIVLNVCKVRVDVLFTGIGEELQLFRNSLKTMFIVEKDTLGCNHDVSECKIIMDVSRI